MPHTPIRARKSDVFVRRGFSHGRSEYITRINAFSLRLSIVEEFGVHRFTSLKRTWYFEEINY